MTDIVVGIDLGTTSSLVGTVLEGNVLLFADAAGSELMPSVVGAGAGGELLVGRAAKNRLLLDPRGTVASVKRTMGTDVRHRVGKRELGPAQVSALILGALLDRAEAKLGQRPGRAVITVPAYFDDAQRQATRDAGQLAGLVVERLVNEPTAAALTYRTGVEQLVMAYDLGGGTFDVSILERDEGVLEVRTSRGDTRLGGDDIDRALVRLVLERLGPKAAGTIESDPRAMTRLVEAVERAKIALSDRDEVRLFDPFIAGEGEAAVHLDMPLTQVDVTATARSFVERTLACIDEAMRDANVRPRDFDRVLLVGGASKMPVVRSLVAEHLARPVQLDLDADRAVALGASLLAGRFAGAAVSEVLVDITPHTLAVGAASGDYEDERDLVAATVIPRGTVLPVERNRLVYTRFDDQPAAEMPIAQGEHRRLRDNTHLGEVCIEDLPSSPAGSPLEVTFRLDVSGVLHVKAVHLPSGKGASVSISNSPYQLTAQRRQAAKAEIEELRAESRAANDDARVPAAPQADAALVAADSDVSLAKAMLARAKRAVERQGADAAAVEKVHAAAAALAKAVDAMSPDVVARTDDLSDALLDLV